MVRLIILNSIKDFYVMKGKIIISSIGIFLIFFAGLLFFALFSEGWFDIFFKGGFKALYGD